MATVKTGTEMIKLQKNIIDNNNEWDKYPLFAVIAGNDYLADPEISVNTLKRMSDKLLTMHLYKDNYHENFNELNRNEIFMNIENWIKNYL